ncbi:Bacterial DNA polymerase III, alpha subunit [uncultured Caudovirales phage]|uniref:Bacterial DNA polymerase III, alpha subunit n=1 Tax=uncultured Caudovirales phage TaxID=2100421 RepID=A0A6J5L888_9CAUD|nr:Bacterial DNA polymerase III, alpha subunit [uncultured Caudovirales phage]
MYVDQFGTQYVSSDQLFDILHQNPDTPLGFYQVSDPEQYNSAITELWSDLPKLSKYTAPQTDFISVDEFDRVNQQRWFMPEQYKQMDIAKYVLDQCKQPEELQRAGMELLLYQERDLFDLLRYLKYFVDTAQKHNLVIGVGRGSSIASFVLYLLKVHRINSLYYQIPIEEFLK